MSNGGAVSLAKRSTSTLSPEQQAKLRSKRGREAMNAAQEEAPDEFIQNGAGPSEPLNIHPGCGLFALMADPATWEQVCTVDPAMIDDPAVREAFEWQLERDVPATRAELCDRYPELAKDAERAL